VSGSSLGADVTSTGEEVGPEVSLLLLGSDGGAVVSVRPSLLGVVGEGDGAEMSPLLATSTTPVISIPIARGLVRSGMLMLVTILILKSSR
jgi:hypothetical protein